MRRLPLILVCLLAACTRWEERPGGQRAGSSAGPIRVIRTDSTSLILRSSRVVGDTLYGVAEGAGASAVALPLSSVRHVAQRQPDHKKTAWLIVGLLVLVGGVLFSLALAQGLREWYGEIVETD